MSEKSPTFPSTKTLPTTKMKHLIITISIFVLTGCSSEIDIAVDPNEEICIIDHLKYWNDPLSKDITSSGCIYVKPNSKELQKIAKWFESNSSKWEVLKDTVQPRYTFRLDIYSVNFNGDSIMIKYHDKNGKEHQLWQPLTKNSFPFSTRLCR